MTFQHKFNGLALVACVSLGLSACGGGGGGSSEPEIETPDPVTPPVSMAVDFGKTVSELVGPEGSTTLPDGNTFDAEGSPIDVPEYMWDIDGSDVDESELDNVFSG